MIGVQMGKRAKGELMRGRIKSSGGLMSRPTETGNGKTVSPSAVGGGNGRYAKQKLGLTREGREAVGNSRDRVGLFA